MNESYRLRYTNQIVGIFLLILLVSVIALGFAVTNVSRILIKPIRYYLVLSEDDAVELRTGTEVIILGKRIGEVKSIDYTDSGEKVRVTLAIDPDHREQMTTDSEISLEKKFGLGATVIRVRRRPDENRQSPATTLPPESEIARFRGEVDRVDQMAREVQNAGSSIDKIEKKLTPTLGSIDGAANKLNDSLSRSFDPAADQGRDAFESIERTSEALRPKTIETLDALKASTDKIENNIALLTQRIDALVEKDIRDTLGKISKSADAATSAAQSVSKTSSNIDTKSDKTNEEIVTTLKGMREAVSSIQRLSQETREIVRIMRGEANELPGTTERVKETVGDAQDLVQEIRGHWLLRRTGREPTPSEQVSPSSIRVGGAP